MARLHQAFLDFGYEQPTMVGLAKACEVTRRTLYNHFSSKEEAFRGQLRWRHAIEITAGLEAGTRVLAEDGSALDAIVSIMDRRYGMTHRALEKSPHAVELNYTAFRRCRDVMSESATTFQDGLATSLAAMVEQKLLRLRACMTPVMLAQHLCDGARGVNQSLPAQPATSLPERYRQMFEVILFGCCER